MEIITENKKEEKKIKKNNSETKKRRSAVIDDFEENLIEKYKNYKIIDLKSFKQFLIEVKNFLFGITLEKSNYVEKNEKEISKQIKYPIKFGLIAIAVTVGFFGIWSGFAPLDSASIAEGFIMLSENKKRIQHLEGGIIDKILIKDGDEVKKGQPLIVLNKFKTKAELENVLWQLRYDLLVDERLAKSLQLISTYQSNDKNIEKIELNFDNKLLKKSNEKILTMIEAQKNSFDFFKVFIKNSIKTFSTQIEQINAEMNSLTERILSHKENICTLQKEFEKKKNMYKKKLETSERLSQTKMELQRQNGQVLEDEARLAGIEHKIAEINARKSQFIEDHNMKLSEEYKKNHSELIKLETQYIHAKDTHKRTTIVAPNAGIITDLKIHTIGAAIRSTEPLLDIIPQDDNLIIEAFIPSQEIDSIHVGSTAKIQLNAYRAKLVPRIDGTVIYISADKFDKRTESISGMSGKFAPIGYYKARIEVSPEELDKVNTRIKLLPGMPVTVFIIKGTRSFAEYLYTPIKDSFHKAFKEP